MTIQLTYLVSHRNPTMSFSSAAPYAKQHVLSYHTAFVQRSIGIRLPAATNVVADRMNAGVPMISLERSPESTLRDVLSRTLRLMCGNFDTDMQHLYDQIRYQSHGIINPYDLEKTPSTASFIADDMKLTSLSFAATYIRHKDNAIV